MELQRTFDGDLVPVAALPDDMVVCSDGNKRRLADAFEDCRGDYHGNEEDRHEQDVSIVQEVLDAVIQWATDYTRHDDYGDDYAYLVGESARPVDAIREWLDDNDDDYVAQLDRWDEFVSAVCDRINAEYECEAEFNHGDYAGYTGKGCCVESFKLDECEEQIEVECHPELQTLHEEGRLDDVLDDVRCDGYISRNRRREKNEKTGYYEPVGRETYNPYGHDHPTFEVYYYPGGGWDYVISADRMRELASEAIAELDERGSDDEILDCSLDSVASILPNNFT